VQVSITQAAHKLGISQDTVRRRLKAGGLIGTKVKAPGGFRWLVDLADIDEQPTAVHPNGETDILRELVNTIQQQLDARTKEISELHRLLAQTALMPPRRRWWTFWR